MGIKKVQSEKALNEFDFGLEIDKKYGFSRPIRHRTTDCSLEV
jgi:hypothetical protein